MRPGDRVAVYGQPQTDSFYQGVATLVRHLVVDRWVVRFDSGRIVTRIVLEKHVEFPFDEYFPSQFDNS